MTPVAEMREGDQRGEEADEYIADACRPGKLARESACSVKDEEDDALHSKELQADQPLLGHGFYDAAEGAPP